MDYDFKKKFADNSYRFFEEWPSWRDKLLDAAYKKAKAEKKKFSTAERFKISVGKYS